jgi:cysteinyl-tRNA synthetase
MKRLPKYTPAEVRNDPYGFTYKEMSEVIGENEAKALYEELYKQLPRKKNLSMLVKNICKSSDTEKYVYELKDNKYIEAVSFIFKLKDGKENITSEDLEELKTLMNAFVFDVLGLQNIEENNNSKLDQTLQVLIELRNQARKAKNFELSDQIRDKLLEQGIELKDGREGTSYVLN